MTPIHSTDTLDELITRVDRLNPELARAIQERVDELRDELSAVEDELTEFRTAEPNTYLGDCRHAQ